MLKNRFAVGEGRIAFIFLPMIMRELTGKVLYIGIAVGFCEHRSGGNREKATVSLYETLVRNAGEFYKTVSVNQQ